MEILYFHLLGVHIILFATITIENGHHRETHYAPPSPLPILSATTCRVRRGHFLQPFPVTLTSGPYGLLLIAAVALHRPPEDWVNSDPYGSSWLAEQWIFVAIA